MNIKAKITLAPSQQHYQNVISHWPKASGVVPTAETFDTVHALNLRPGSKHALACAMYLRTEGATDREVIAAADLMNEPHRRGRQTVLHNYAFDKTIGLCGKVGWCKRNMNAPARDGARVYHMTLTARGNAQVARWQKANGIAPVAPVATDTVPVKAARKPRPRKPALPVAPQPAADAPVTAADVTALAQHFNS